MTQPQTSPAGPVPTGRTFDDFLRTNEKGLGIGLLAAAALFLIIPLINLIWLFQKKPANTPVMFWGLFLAASALFGGLWIRLREPTREIGPIDSLRLAILTVGSLAGLATVFLGLWLPFGAWSSAFIPAAPASGEQAVPIIRLWRENAWRITACAAAVFFGLGLMFASLQLARTSVRVSATMRRLLFGYNAALTGLLLLAILFVVNVLAYVPMKPFLFFDRAVDWTPSQIFTLSDNTENLLKGLDKPPRITILMPRNLLITRDVEQLVQNMKKIDPRVDSRLIEPEQNPEDFDTELRKYRIRIDDVISQELQMVIGGVVVEYGGDHVFIRGRDLFQPVRGGGEREAFRYAFKGEQEMAKALRKLSEKTPAKVYFTQGNGELDLNDVDRFHFDQGAGLLKEHLLSRGNYDIQELKFTPATEGVPKDAHVVVVARPTTPLPTRAVQALRAYMKRPEQKDKDGNVLQTRGKLLVLLDVVLAADNKMLQTGLEGLLREFSVEVGNDRLLSTDRLLGGAITLSEQPENLRVLPDARSRNPVALAFFRGAGRRTFAFQTVRSVTPQQKGGPRGGASAEALLNTVPNIDVWKTTDLTTPPRQLFADSVRNRSNELRQQIDDNVSVAVTVSEGTQTIPIAGHAPIPGKETPRMVVFGDATWITNMALTRPDGKDAKDLFTSCVAWLRERPDIGVDVGPAKVRPVFTLKGKVDEGSAAASRLYWLPPLFILVSILALGGGVWVSRRR